MTPAIVFRTAWKNVWSRLWRPVPLAVSIVTIAVAEAALYKARSAQLAAETALRSLAPNTAGLPPSAATSYFVFMALFPLVFVGAVVIVTVTVEVVSVRRYGDRSKPKKDFVR
jgi:hypothetical protein